MALGKRIKREFHISLKEKKGMFITAFVGALVIFMFAWRVTNYTLRTGILSFLAIVILGLVSMYMFVAGAKIVANIRGYEAQYAHWTNGLLTGFVVSFISYGLIPIVLPGNIEIKTIDRLRHGKVYFGENKKDIFFVLGSAVLASLFTSFIFFYIFLFTKIQLFYYGVIFNAIIAFMSLLPFTQNIGATLFFARKNNYFGLLGLTAIYFLVIISSSVLPLIILIIGAIAYWIIIGIKNKKK
ncbi:hypothetical protein K9M74_02430 [Candidatus Woesearchaeota archaeon]|nr:hypothetical protein [Candidatus Woesearchaeota archaeon]